MSALVEIQDISKIYNPGENEVRALDHISLTIQKGEFVAIIGQSDPDEYDRLSGCADRGNLHIKWAECVEAV